MYLYLIRHGDALSGSPDKERLLSDRGKEETKEVGKFLQKAGIEIETVYHSGLKRAEETAEIIVKILGTKAAVKKSGLAPDDPVLSICEEILKREEDLMIVGHMPHLSNLVSRLLVGREEADLIDFRKSAALALEKKFDGPWRIQWCVTPKLL